MTGPVGDVDAVVDAIAAGLPVLLPTDTVYGLCAAPERDAVERLYRLKGRAPVQPTALLAAGVDVLVELVPELDGDPAAIAHALLPGPFTLVVPNPARRYAWLAGGAPETIGLRVPQLAGEPRRALERIRAVAATSANLPGGRDPRRLAHVPDEIRAGCAAELDAGELPGTASTVLDLTGAEPRVLRAGAVPADEALARVAAALR